MQSMSIRLVLLLTAIATVASFKFYQNQIPHGHQTLNPCDLSHWVGVGHKNPGGGGALNQFGMDFAAANHQWTKQLCNMDSDGDGMSNGEELGDPGCTWGIHDHGHLQPVKGHPGVCEPVGDAKCADNWLTC